MLFQAPRYHNELIDRYLKKLSHQLVTTDLNNVLIHLRREYAESASSSQLSLTSFALSKDVDHEVILLRGKLVLLLHTSNIYDVIEVRRKLEEIEELYFEKALIYGKVSCDCGRFVTFRLTDGLPSQLGLHEAALTILAKTLRDLVAAEAYCTHAGTGDILGPKNVRELVSNLGIPYPSALLRRNGRRRLQTPPGTSVSPVAREAKRTELLNMLIKMSLEQSTMDSSASAQQRAAHIIETQAIRISAEQILPSIPNDWPLPFMESFLIRSMRRSFHERYEGKLIKALLQGQMTEMSLRYFDVTEALGGTLAEEANGDNDERDKGDAADNEKDGEVFYMEKEQGYDEKTVDLL